MHQLRPAGCSTTAPAFPGSRCLPGPAGDLVPEAGWAAGWELISCPAPRKPGNQTGEADRAVGRSVCFNVPLPGRKQPSAAVATDGRMVQTRARELQDSSPLAGRHSELLQVDLLTHTLVTLVTLVTLLLCWRNQGLKPSWLLLLPHQLLYCCNKKQENRYLLLSEQAVSRDAPPR